MATRREVLEKIKICEQEKKFDEHVDPIDYDNCYPVDENFRYIKKGFKERLKNFFLYYFVVCPYTFYINKFVTKTRVVGRNNIRGIKKAIVICNHVYMFDCLVAKGSLHHRLYITAASFNNQKGRMGDYMRAGGMMPIGEGLKALRNFDKAIETRLNQNSYVMFYPEASMWWHYEKPRPFKNGAFHYAVKYNVPVIPTFITYVNTGKVDEEGLEIKQFIYNILPPIYPKKELNNKENVQYLKETSFIQIKELYEKFYDEKLDYDCEGR